MHEYIKIITGCDLRSQLKYLEGLIKKGCLYIGNKNSDATVMCAVTVRRNTSARTVKIHCFLNSAIEHPVPKTVRPYPELSTMIVLVQGSPGTSFWENY